MDEHEHHLEILKARLDTLKHITTLSGAGTAAVVAIYREGVLDRSALTVTLFMFAISVITGLLGISFALDDIARLPLQESGTTKLCWVLSIITFGAGIGGVLVDTAIRAFEKQNAMWYVIIAAVVVFFLILGYLGGRDIR